MEKKQKKYLLISPDFPPPLVGGSLVWLLNLIENCPSDFDVLTGIKNQNYQEVLNSPNKVIRSKFIKDSHNPTRIELLIMYIYMPVWLIINQRKEKYDAVLVNPGVVGNSILFWVGKFFNIKIIGAGHGEEITMPLYGKGIKNYLKRFLMNVSYKQSSGFFVVCHFCKRLLVELGVKEGTIDVIPSCLNKNKINIDPSISKIKYKVISVGRFIERKGFHLLIEAIVELRKEIKDITLDLVGTGPMKDVLINQINEAGASDYIKLFNNISDKELSNLYQRSSLFILAHMLLENGDTEGCPTVFSEAMGHNLPLIGGTGAGADTAIIQGKNGYVVDVRNKDDLMYHIKKIITDQDLSNKMIEYGKQKLEKDHDPEKNGKALQNTICRLIKGDKATGAQEAFNLLDKNILN